MLWVDAPLINPQLELHRQARQMKLSACIVLVATRHDPKTLSVGPRQIMLAETLGIRELSKGTIPCSRQLHRTRL
jgi:hypothetical protein